MADTFVSGMVELGHRLAGSRLDVRPIVELGHRLRAEDEKDLVAFRDRIVRMPDRLREVWMGKTALGRQRLRPPQRSMLDVLGLMPDLLEPSQSRRDEVMHTQTIAWFLSGNAAARAAFFQMLDHSSPRHGHVSSNPEHYSAGPWNVVPERGVGRFGRVDIWLQSKDTTVVVEAKLDAPEGLDQVARYNEAKRQYCRTANWVVVFLTVDPDLMPSGAALQVTFLQLLQAWLPVAVGGDTGAHHHLRSYLASLARVCGVGLPGDFDDWPPAVRRNALELVMST